MPSPPAARFPGSCLPPSPLSPACRTHRATRIPEMLPRKDLSVPHPTGGKTPAKGQVPCPHASHNVCGPGTLPAGDPGPQALLPKLDAQLPPFLPHLTGTIAPCPVPSPRMFLPVITTGQSQARRLVCGLGLRSPAQEWTSDSGGYLDTDTHRGQRRVEMQQMRDPSTASVTPEAGEMPGLEPSSQPQWEPALPNTLALGFQLPDQDRTCLLFQLPRLGRFVRQPC